MTSHVNYSSFYQEEEAADKDLERIVEAGFAEKISDVEVIRKRYGDVLRLPKIAVITKLRGDGSKKTRLIVDMRRSGTNGQIVARERVVLPRMTDFSESVLDILEENTARAPRQALQQLPTAGIATTKDCELFCFDFKDAL